MMRELALFLAFVMPSMAGFGTVVPAATYYVDSINGSDSNNGTTAATPFLTITHVMGLSPTTGTVIALGTSSPSLGGSWKGQTINTSTSGLTFVGYGDVQPLIDCSASISAGAWTKTGGFTNIYQATVTVENVNGWIRLWENDISFIRPFPDTQAQLDATASAYRVSGDPNGGGTVSFTIFVHTSDGSNPATNGKTYDYNEFGCITLLGDNSTVINLHTQRNLSNNGSVDCHGSFCRLIDILAEDGTKHSIYVGPGAYIYRSTAHNAYYALQGSDLFVYNANSPNLEGITFNTTNAYMDTPSSGAGGVGAYLGHVNTSGSFGVVDYYNASCSGTSSAYNAGNSTLAFILGGTCTNVAGGMEVGGLTQVNGVTMQCLGNCFQMFSVGPLKIQNSTLTGGIAVQDFVGNSNVSITGSTVSGTALYQTGVGSGMTVYSHNNTITAASTPSFVYNLATGFNLDSDFNIFLINAFLDFQLGSNFYQSVSAYQAATGQDSHSTHP